MFGLTNYDPCGMFCQQSIEKRMKHYLSVKGSSDDMRLFSCNALVPLYSRICELEGVIPDRGMQGDLHELTSYYFDTNYPKAVNIELTQEMADDAIRITELVNARVDGMLTDDNPPEIDAPALRTTDKLITT